MLPKGTWGGKAFSEKGLFQFIPKAIHERNFESHMRGVRERKAARETDGTRSFYFFVRHWYYETVVCEFHAAALRKCVSSQYKLLSILKYSI